MFKKLIKTIVKVAILRIAMEKKLNKRWKESKVFNNQIAIESLLSGIFDFMY